ncbi:MAG: bifunctional folylpolyglutamate synthase/dihydrofolate synthase [Schwartzia sp. (in: firmicutes)]
MTYQEALAWLEELGRFGIQLGLLRMERLAERLGNPERRYHTVHVTGTNGKGSVSAILAAALTRCGISTGLYTSPHLVSYTERMCVDGQAISEADFARTLTRVRQAVEDMVAAGEESPTQFEVLTAQAFLWFAEQGAKYAVVEVGLGGLLDSTNIVRPDLAIITNVTLEHADRCGGTLEGIAQHKAGILKAGVPAVTAAQGMPLKVIRQTATEKNAPLYVAGEDFSSRGVGVTEGRQKILFSWGKAGCDCTASYEVSLLGDHQRENAAVAIQAFRVLRAQDGRLTETALREALRETVWPGRFEAMALGGVRILVDGAHNPAGIAALRTALDDYFPSGSRVFLLGILQDKDIDVMLRILLRPEDRVVLTRPDSERAADPADVAPKAAVREVRVEPQPTQALKSALTMAGDGSLLVVTGSLYLIGRIRALLLEQKGGDHEKDGGCVSA